MLSWARRLARLYDPGWSRERVWEMREWMTSTEWLFLYYKLLQCTITVVIPIERFMVGGGFLGDGGLAHDNRQKQDNKSVK